MYLTYCPECKKEEITQKEPNIEYTALYIVDADNTLHLSKCVCGSERRATSVLYGDGEKEGIKSMIQNIRL